MDRIIEGLNERQREAVECLEGPVLILAGAGSGKTKTLTHRIANLIAHGVKPHEILAVTFTNKAAREMRGRLWKLLRKGEPIFSSSGLELSSMSYAGTPAEEPPRSFMPYMGTFHGIAVKILRQEAEAVGLDKNFVIYDTDDQTALVRKILKDLQYTDDKSLKPKSIQTIISNEKNQGNGPEDYEARAYYPNQKKIAKVFYRYEEEKTKASALDFDDLLLYELKLLRECPEVRRKWQERFKHILIDEYQDTNQVQYNIVRLLVNEERNICVVGDDWQSIYSWRGADFTNILNFERDFPGAKCVKLEQNYRSTGRILAASQKIINENKTRTDKTLFTEAGEGEPVDIEGLRDEKAEANFVALKVMGMQGDYADLGDFAVLYRTNAQSYAFERVFVEMHIPYKIVGGVRFYDRKEVKDVLAILKLVMNEWDKVSLARVCNNVLSGIGEASVRKVMGAMDAIGGQEVLKNADLPEVLNATKARNALVRLINFLKKVGLEDRPDEIVREAVEYFDFQKLTDDGTSSSEERMQNLEVLAGNAAEYDNLEEFLADASLMSSADEALNQDAVTLMTMHAAKGLEFPVVFVVGLEEGLFPSGRAMGEEAGLEEERRLMYVAMTRAMRKLFLTYAESRYTYGSRNYNMPSRFLAELGYNPYEASKGLTGGRDENGDGFKDFDFDEGFDVFPDDLPVWE